MLLKCLSYLLIASFSVLFVPRSIWHTHEEIKENQLDCSHSEDLEEDCYICDFTLQPALMPLNFVFQFPTQPIIGYVAKKIEIHDLFSFNFHFLRGPPIWF